MIDDLKLLKGTGETTIVPSSEIIAGDGYYYHHDIKRLFLYHVENFDYTLNDLDEVTNSDIEELVLCACPNINISLPITNWGYLTSLTIDEFTLTPGTYDRDYDTYDPPIWKTLLEEIKAIGAATGSQLHTLRLDSLVGVGDYALIDISTNPWRGCSSLVEASFKKLVSAGNYLLYNCTSLTTVYLPLLVSAGNYLLWGCTSLTTVSLPLLASAGYGLLSCCIRLKKADLPSLETVESGNWGLLEGCSSLEKVSLPKLTTGGRYLLYNCTSLTSVYLPLLASAGYGLLTGCTGLKKADLPSLETVESGSWGLLEGCSSLEKVSLPLLTTGGKYLLASCTSLRKLYFGVITVTLGDNAFDGVATSNIDLYLPAGHGITGNTWNNKTWKSINEYPGDVAWDLL